MFCVFKSSEERSGADPAGAPSPAARRVPAVSTLPQLPDWLRRDGRQQCARRWAGVHPQEAADAAAHRAAGAGSKALLHGPLGDLQAAAQAPTGQGRGFHIGISKRRLFWIWMGYFSPFLQVSNGCILVVIHVGTVSQTIKVSIDDSPAQVKKCRDRKLSVSLFSHWAPPLLLRCWSVSLPRRPTKESCWASLKTCVRQTLCCVCVEGIFYLFILLKCTYFR